MTELTEELERRKQLLSATGQPNIDHYNAVSGDNLPRYIFACDEVAEMLDKTDAADQIPEDAQGRFILQDGTVFQAYWFDDAGGG